MALLALYFFSFSRFLAWQIPEYPANVNAGFADNAWRLALGTAGLCLVAALVLRFQPAGRRVIDFKRAPLKPGDLLLLLIPVTPVFQYVLNNQDILRLPDSLFLLGVFAGGSFVFILVIPRCLARVVPALPLALAGLAFVFSIANMASLSQELAWFEKGNLAVQSALVAAMFGVGWLLGRLESRRALYALAVAYFCVNSLIQFSHARQAKGTAQPDKYPPPETGHKLIEAIGPRKPLRTPNIYLLVYDSYVANETLRQYGLDNRAQEEYLAGLGFQLFPHAYSIAADSVRSINRVLDATVSYHGNRNRSVAGDGVVHRLLKQFGYETYGLFHGDYFFRGGVEVKYTHAFPVAKSNVGRELLKAILMGEFRFDLKFNEGGAAPLFTYEDFLARKHDVLIGPSRRPKFVYVHTPQPGHSQNSGGCRTNETELYAARLETANAEMNADLSALLQQDPSAIIIVAGDHGPYLTKNCQRTHYQYDISEIDRLDIQDRYGAFLAIRWPHGQPVPYGDITVLQDIFVAVFAYLYGDASMLAAKVSPVTGEPWVTSGAYVTNGIIVGGKDDGGSLFLEPIPAAPVARP